MAQIQINFQGTDARLNRLFEAYARENGWTDTVLVDEVPTPNPVSFIAYAKDTIKLQIREAGIRQRTKTAVEAARMNAIAEATDDAANVLVTNT